jgi:hypothetical protein
MEGIPPGPAALAKSGTVTVELALAQVPTVLAYKVTLLNQQGDAAQSADLSAP